MSAITLQLRAIAGGIQSNPQTFPPQGTMGAEWPATLREAADSIDRLRELLARAQTIILASDMADRPVRLLAGIREALR